MTYLSSLEGGIAIAPNFNGNADKYNAVHLGYAGGTKAVSILADGSLSLNTEYSAGAWTGNVGTAGDILTSGGEGQPAVWGSTISLLGTGEDNQVLTFSNDSCGWADIPQDQELKIKQTNTILQNISPAIYADGRPPTAPTTAFINSYAYTPAWYFKNTVAGYKINWYAGPYAGMTVADLLGMYMYMFNGLTTSNDNTPFLTVYTQPQAGDPTFYHSRRTYIFNQEVTPVANTRYCLFANISGTCPTPAHYGQTLNVMITGNVVGTNVGPFDPTELILFFAIGSNSASAVNSVEFAVSKLGIMTPTGTQEFAYIPL
jgi:hypothetical protein